MQAYVEAAMTGCKVSFNRANSQLSATPEISKYLTGSNRGVYEAGELLRTNASIFTRNEKPTATPIFQQSILL